MTPKKQLQKVMGCRRRRALSLLAACVSGVFVALAGYSSVSSPTTPLLDAAIHDAPRTDPYWSLDTASQRPSSSCSTSTDAAPQEDPNNKQSLYYNADDSIHINDELLIPSDAGDLGTQKIDYDEERTSQKSSRRKKIKATKSREFGESAVRIKSVVEAASESITALRNFAKESTDVFSSQGNESDYLFPPCQQENDNNKKAPSLYGFVGPFRYLANYKNPCWMEYGHGDTPLVHCVPYFYLAGAPKAGSTDVYKRIAKHPDVVAGVLKETRWFDRARFEGKPHFSTFLHNYENAAGVIHRSLDKGNNYHSRIIGDGSPSYYFDNRRWQQVPGNEGCREPRVTVASHIHHLYPQSRIILVLRNPVDRLYSSYLYNHGKYELVSSKTFDKFVREAITLYNDCFARYSLRQCANNATVFQQAKVMIVIGVYSVFLQDWLELFPKEQLFFMTTEKYSEHMEDHLSKIFSFLKLRPLSSPELVEITHTKASNAGHRYEEVGPMLATTRTLLEDFYRPYNQRLAHLLNDPRFLWVD